MKLSYHDFYMRKNIQKRHHKTQSSLLPPPVQNLYIPSLHHPIPTRHLVYRKNTTHIYPIAQRHSPTTTYFLRRQIFRTQTYRPTQPYSKTKLTKKSFLNNLFCKNFCKPTNHTDVRQPTTLK